MRPRGRSKHGQENWEESPAGWPQTAPYQWWRRHDEYGKEMSERDGYQHGVPCWVDTLQPDPEAARRSMPPCSAGSSQGRASEHSPPHWSVNFWVDDADATVDKAAELGGKIVVPPFDTPVGRDAVIADPQGAVFSVSKVTAAQ